MSVPIHEASALYEQRRFEQAAVHAREILVEEPDRVDALTLLALCAAGAERWDVADTAIGRALAISPQSGHAKRVASAVLRMRGRTGEAAAHATEALRHAPGDPHVHCELASIALADRRWEDALNAAERGLSLAPAHPGLVRARGLARAQQDAVAELPSPAATVWSSGQRVPADAPRESSVEPDDLAARRLWSVEPEQRRGVRAAVRRLRGRDRGDHRPRTGAGVRAALATICLGSGSILFTSSLFTGSPALAIGALGVALLAWPAGRLTTLSSRSSQFTLGAYTAVVACVLAWGLAQGASATGIRSAVLPIAVVALVLGGLMAEALKGRTTLG